MVLSTNESSRQLARGKLNPRRLEQINFSRLRREKNIDNKIELDHIEKFGKESQALIGGYDSKFLNDLIKHKSHQNSEPDVPASYPLAF